MKATLANDLTIGFDDAGQGKTVLLLHAFPLARMMWRSQAEVLQRSYRVVVPDLRGFGSTRGFDGTPSLERMADDAVALLDHLQIDQAIVGGLSMGGYVALAFARKYSDRLRGLVLADTRAEADNAEGKAGRERLLAFLETHTAADVIDQMLPRMVSSETRQRRPEVINQLRRIASAQTPAGVKGALCALRDRVESTSILKTLKAPTLVIVGSDDMLTPRSAADVLKAFIPGARLAVIPGAGHISNMEQPQLFNEVLLEFLETIP